MKNSKFGRKWELKLSAPDSGFSVTISQENLSDSPLRVAFDIDYPRYLAFYVCDFTVWNLKSEIVNSIIMNAVEGMEVIFSA